MEGTQIKAPGVNIEVCKSFNAVLEAQAKLRCKFCSGWGHELKECMALIKATRSARFAGLGYHWGAIKSVSYYEAMVVAAAAEPNALVGLMASRKRLRKK